MKIRTGHLPILWELLFRSILYLEILLYIMKRKNEREGGLLEKEKVKFFRLKEGFEPFAAPRIRCRSSLLSVDLSGGNNLGTEDRPRPAFPSKGRLRFKRLRFSEEPLCIIGHGVYYTLGEKAIFSNP